MGSSGKGILIMNIDNIVTDTCILLGDLLPVSPFSPPHFPRGGWWR